jgi:hypothetical protein
MAVTDWPYAYTTSGSATYTFSPSFTSNGYSMPLMLTSSGSGGWTAPAPREPTALEWLDAEIEATCKLARVA